MRKTKTEAAINASDRRAVDTKTLQAMLGSGRQSAVAVGEAAEAKIRIGRRVLWNLSKVQRYLDEVSE